MNFQSDEKEYLYGSLATDVEMADLDEDEEDQVEGALIGKCSTY